MNSLIAAADRFTQLKLLLVALAASGVVVGVGLAGKDRTEILMPAGADTIAPIVERIQVKPVAPPQTHTPGAVW
jgi:hypothetical protein